MQFAEIEPSAETWHEWDFIFTNAQDCDKATQTALKAGLKLGLGSFNNNVRLSTDNASVAAMLRGLLAKL